MDKAVVGVSVTGADALERRAETPEDDDAGTDLFRAVGRQIKLLRERTGLTQRELGERLNYGEDLISSLERGRRTPQPEFLDAADDLLGAGGLLKALKEDVARARARTRVRHPAWFRDFARLEAEAVEIHEYSSQAVPGLFQTEGYARAIFSGRRPLLDEDTIEQRVVARLARQDVLTRWPAPTVTAIIQESVIQQPFGGREVWRGQLAHLLKLGRLRNVEIQVMPTDREEHAGMGGPFTVLTPRGKPQLGYVEVQHVSRLMTDADEVRVLAAKYGSMRGQALSTWESLSLIEKLLGAL